MKLAPTSRILLGLFVLILQKQSHLGLNNYFNHFVTRLYNKIDLHIIVYTEYIILYGLINKISLKQIILVEKYFNVTTG